MRESWGSLMQKISVIIPIYKGKRYIPNLIRMMEDNIRFIGQEESAQIEMILVNDFPDEKIELRGVEGRGNLLSWSD